MKVSTTFRIVLLASAVAMFCSSLWATAIPRSTEEAKVSDATASDQFGNSVALQGTRAVIGALMGDGNDPVTGHFGAAAVFDLRNGVWTETTVFQASDGMTNDAFGETVALSGNRVLVGTRLSDTAGGINAGAAYFFTVPEPSSLALSVLGVLGLLVFARRGRRRV